MKLTFSAYNGTRLIKTGIQIEDLAEYKEKNPSYSYKSEGSEKTGREKFMSGLSPTQIQDVKDGYKAVKYSSALGEDGVEIGYYLKVMKEKEASTPRLLESNKRQYVLSFLRTNCSDLYGAFASAVDVDIDEDFFNKVIKSLV